MAGSALIGNLAVNLSMETAAFNRSASLTEKRVQGMKAKLGGLTKSFAGGFGLALGGAAIAAGLSSVVSSAFDMASSLSEASEKLGLTVEGLQRLRLAAGQTGVSNDQLDVAMTRLNKSLGGLQLGSKSAVDAFAQIGLSADDLKGKQPDEALRIIADALNKIPDASSRAAIGAAIFGKGYAALIPLINGGSKALNDYAEQSKKNGEISTADAKKLDDLADRWDKFKSRVGVVTATLVAAFAGLAEKVGGSMAGLSESMVMVHDAIANLARGAVEWVGRMVTGIGEAITGRLNAIWDGAKAKITEVKNAFFHMYDAVVGHSYVPDMVAGIGESMAELQKVMVDPAAKATDKVSALFSTLGQTVGSIFGQKAGGILSAVGQLASALGPLFGGGTALSTRSGGSAGASSVPIPHFARGGAGVFGGHGGTDRNLLSLNGSPIARVSRGEHFSVSPNGGGSRVTVVPSPLFDVVVDGRAAQVAAPMASRAAMVGAAGGQQAAARSARRSIP